VPTSRGDAEVLLDQPPRRPRGLLVVGHGASGGVETVDLTAARDAALDAGLAVARVTQPYRVAGRRTPPAAPVLDEAWTAVVAAVREAVGVGKRSGVEDVRRGNVPLVVGGRSSGARVACRTAHALGAVGVLALAFPLHPPGRPTVTRADELDARVPTLVVNGDRDPFGVPEPDGLIRVVVRPGDRHDLRRDPAGLRSIVGDWLAEVLASRRSKRA
jgi:predicted alpha/beta-hydrolase family hydrolase